MVASKSGKLVKLINEILKALDKKEERSVINNLLRDLAAHIYEIATEMKEMYHRSAIDDFHKFRTFMSGCKNNVIFPNGVVFEGVSEEAQFIRGSSAA